MDVRLDKDVIQALQLDINAYTVRNAIVASKLKVKAPQITCAPAPSPLPLLPYRLILDAKASGFAVKSAVPGWCYRVVIYASAVTLPLGHASLLPCNRHSTHGWEDT